MLLQLKRCIKCARAFDDDCDCLEGACRGRAKQFRIPAVRPKRTLGLLRLEDLDAYVRNSRSLNHAEVVVSRLSLRVFPGTFANALAFVGSCTSSAGRATAAKPLQWQSRGGGDPG